MGGSRESGNPSSRLRLVGSRGREARGQTTLDFAFGIGIFLLIVAFVFLFVPSMLDPVSGGGQEERVVADRLATQLATGMLAADSADPADPASPTDPYVLDTDCTDFFFDPPGSPDPPNPGDCRFTGTTLKERLAVDTYPDDSASRYSVRIGLTGSGFDDKAISEPDRTTPPKSSANVFTARRTVQYDGNSATLSVRVW